MKQNTCGKQHKIHDIHLCASTLWHLNIKKKFIDKLNPCYEFWEFNTLKIFVFSLLNGWLNEIMQ